MVLPFHPWAAALSGLQDFKHVMHLPTIEVSNVEFDDNYCFNMCVYSLYFIWINDLLSITVLSLTGELIFNSLLWF